MGKQPIISHSDSREHINEHKSVHAGNIARDGGKPKGGTVMVHPGMQTKSQSGADALSGHHASAIDALSGQVVVPGRVTATPRFGNGGIANNDHPLAKAPGGKNLQPVPPAFGMRSQSADKRPMAEIGKAMWDEAMAASGSDDRQAHGRGE